MKISLSLMSLKGATFFVNICHLEIKVITKLPNSEQSYKGKVKTHNYIKRQNQKYQSPNYCKTKMF